MKKYLFLFLTIGFLACNDDEPTPECIEDLLTSFQSTTACVGDNLASWDFQGEKVYCFADGFCLSISTARVYDGDCNLICTMGGAAGLTTCNGVPWLQNASNETLIWEKEN